MYVGWQTVKFNQNLSEKWSHFLLVYSANNLCISAPRPLTLLMT